MTIYIYDNILLSVSYRRGLDITFIEVNSDNTFNILHHHELHASGVYSFKFVKTK